MAAELKAAMEKGELKKLLSKTGKNQPVSCAVAQGDGKTSAPGLILLDKVKGPKAVLKELQQEFPEAKNERFGTALVDHDENPKLVKLTINKAISGMAKRLVKALKGTGYNKVQILLEDGSVVEADEEQDDEAQQQPPAPSARGDQPQPQPATAQGGQAQPAAPAAPDGQQQAGPDVKELTETLVALVKQLPPIIAADPTQQRKLTEVAGDAKAALASGDLGAAAAHIENLQDLIDGAAPASANGANGNAANASAGQQPAPPNGRQAAAGGPNPVVISKSRLAWVAARQKVESEIGKLHDAISEVYKDHGAAEHLEKAFQSRVEGMLSTLDHSLSDKLDEVSQAASPNDRARLVGEAQQIMQRYQDYLSSEPLIAKMDANPFAPVAVHKTLTATLAALSKSVR